MFKIVIVHRKALVSMAITPLICCGHYITDVLEVEYFMYCVFFVSFLSKGARGQEQDGRKQGNSIVVTKS